MKREGVKRGKFVIEKRVKGMGKNLRVSEFFRWNGRMWVSGEDVGCGREK